MASWWVKWIGIGLGLGLGGCNKTSEPAPSGSPPPSTGEAQRPGPEAAQGPREVGWDAPAAWTKSDKGSPMRKATYVVPHAPADAEDAELSVAQAGGTVEQNIERWAKQLDRTLADAKRTTRTVNGLKVTVVEIHGDYSGMAMPGAAAGPKKTGWALLGAIVESSPPTFFKLTGPDKTAAAARADFDKLVESLRAK